MDLCACSSKYSDTQHRFEVFVEDGVRIACTTGGPKYTDDLFRYEVLIQLQADSSISESFLNRPISFIESLSGNYLVCDEGDRRIAVYSPSGEYVKSFGRPGHGPGEFQSISLLDIIDGVLVMYDRSQRRTTLFSEYGELIGVYRVLIGGSIDAMYPLSDHRQLSLQGLMDLRGEEVWRAMKALVMASSLDTIAYFETPYIHCRMSLRRNLNISYSVYFSAFPCIGYAPPLGVYSYDPTHPELRWFNTEGQPVRIFRFDLPRIPPSQADIALIEASWEERARGPEGEAARLVRNNLVFADFVPYWSTVVVDDNCFCWLSKYEPQATKERLGGTAFRVVSPDGEYLGDTRWPMISFESNSALGIHIANGKLMVINPLETESTMPTVYSIIPVATGLNYPY